MLHTSVFDTDGLQGRQRRVAGQSDEDERAIKGKEVAEGGIYGGTKTMMVHIAVIFFGYGGLASTKWASQWKSIRLPPCRCEAGFMQGSQHICVS